MGTRHAAESVVVGWTAAVTWVTLAAYVLGWCGWLASRPAWLVVLALGAVMAGRPRPVPAVRLRFRRWRQLTLGRPWLALALALVGWLTLTNLALVLAAAPNQWDAMLYHLARVGYFLQQGSFAAYGANFYSQEELGRGAATLVSCLMVLCGKSDVLVGLPQFTAWIASGCAVAAIARTWSLRPSACAFAGAVWMTLSIAWLEAVTAQNDVLITAHLACALLGLRRFTIARSRATAGGPDRLVWLALAGLSLGLAFGTKASALTAIPAVVLAGASAFLRTPADGPASRRRRVAVAAGRLALVAGAALPVTLPAGYVENLQRFGQPLGSTVTEEHLFHGRGPGPRALSGLRNAVRFSSDFATLDQVPPVTPVSRAWAAFKRPIVPLFASLGLDLKEPSDRRMGFSPDRVFRPDDNLSYFGPSGLFLVLGYLTAWRQRRFRWLAVAATLFFVTQCLAGPYDATRGRQFLYGTILALPAIATWVGRHGRRRWHWRAATATVLLAAVSVYVAPAAVLRNNHDFFPNEGRPRAFWQKDRIDQMTGFHASNPAHRKFNELVPADATVGVALSGYEYPLFGPRLSRTLVPLTTQVRTGAAFPPGLEWFVFASSVHPPAEADIDLGIGWHLRRLAP
ncbi:MAG: hypothetical protein IAE82_18560 [Opitutaceae bacterium]|nr:hypothetical protein [Opitutaceae bacterium]